MKRPRIAVIGSNNVDLVTYVTRMPKPGETLEAPRFEMGPGGKGANQAVAAAKLGAEVAFVTAIGDDLFGASTLRTLAAAGIDAGLVRKVAGKPNGVASIMVDPSGENCILIVKGANGELSPDDVERAGPALKTCDLILLQLEIPLETVYAAIRFGKAHGVRTVLNPAPANRRSTSRRCATPTISSPTKPSSRILTGMPTESEADVEAAAKRLLSARARRR